MSFAQQYNIIIVASHYQERQVSRNSRSLQPGSRRNPLWAGPFGRTQACKSPKGSFVIAGFPVSRSRCDRVQNPGFPTNQGPINTSPKQQITTLGKKPFFLSHLKPKAANLRHALSEKVSIRELASRLVGWSASRSTAPDGKLLNRDIPSQDLVATGLPCHHHLTPVLQRRPLIIEPGGLEGGGPNRGFWK